MSNIKLINPIIPIIIKRGIKNGVINIIIIANMHTNIIINNNCIIKYTILYKFICGSGEFRNPDPGVNSALLYL